MILTNQSTTHNPQPKKHALERPSDVARPPHYTYGELEAIDITELLGTNLGNVVKYVWRAGEKPYLGQHLGDKNNQQLLDCHLLGLRKDLDKARWYLSRLESRKEMTLPVIDKVNIALGMFTTVQARLGVITTKERDEVLKTLILLPITQDFQAANDAIDAFERTMSHFYNQTY